MASMASRARSWLRDERIVVLDFYVQNGGTASSGEKQELSRLLRSIPIEQELTANPKFRGPAAVGLKIANFLSIESDGAHGLSDVATEDWEVWREFAHDPDHLHETAEAIRANLGNPESSATAGAETDGEDDEEAEEGRLLTRVHRARERSRKLVRRKKRGVLQRTGRLACEGCGFDFAEVYGERGSGLIECHHLVPLESLRPGQATRLSDLALVCSNCHRMIHRSRPWLSLDALRALMRQTTPS